MAQRTILITGGTRGIGRACALRLARDGSRVVLGYAHNADAAAETEAEILGLGVKCLTVQADLTTDEGIALLFDTAAQWAGTIDAVVNNAGATLHIGPLAETPVDVIRQVIDLNLTSAILVAREAAQRLPRGGAIVNISSGAATSGSPGEYVHYAAAKAGVDALTKGLALELASKGIRVVGVAPSAISTDIHADAGAPDRPARIAERHPMGRVGTPEEVAGVVAFALSHDADYVSGATIRVTGAQ